MEARLTALETRLDTILPTLATKSDVADVRADISRWTLQTMLAIIATMLAGIFGVAQVFKAQTPAAPPTQQPIIINIPAAQAPASSPGR